MISSIQFRRKIKFKFGGVEKDGELFAGNVKWSEEKEKWACSWSVSEIHPEIGVLYGSDPLDALIRTLDFLSILIRGSEEDGLAVWWSQPGDHCGLQFPLSEDHGWKKVPPNYTGKLPPVFRKGKSS